MGAFDRGDRRRTLELRMNRSRTVLWSALAGAGVALAIASVAARADSANPVEGRQAAMKHVSQTMKAAAAYTSSQTPFDAAKVKALMDGLAADARKLHDLYPAGSGADPKTAAGPKIWEDRPDFDKRIAELSSLAVAAGKTTSADTFKPAFSALGATCKSCHDIYRKRKS
jgi:cytochrome c556